MQTRNSGATLFAMLLSVSACTDNQFGNPVANPAANPVNVSSGISWTASQMTNPGLMPLDDSMLAMLGQWERQELGVTPMNELQSGNMHMPTPASIPGGQVITTRELMSLQGQGANGAVLILDVLSGPQRIPGAQNALPAAQGGSFDDRTQQQFGDYLQQATGGNRAMPIVTYCQGRDCWMSYNAALRAIALGYSNVLWYRGGFQAWLLAGRPVESGPAAALQPPNGLPPPSQQPGPAPAPAPAPEESLWSKLMKPIGALRN